MSKKHYRAEERPVARLTNAGWVLCDFQMPDCLPEVRFDEKYFIEQLATMGIQTLLFVCQSAHGNCFYHTKVGYPNRAMKGEIFRKVCAYAREKGIRIIAYFNQLLNKRLAETHPEWMQTDVKGTRLTGFNHYPTFCMNCDPYRERVGAQIREIAAQFDITGFFLDINYWHPRGCYCEWCRRKFKETYGYELAPDNFTAIEHWLDFYAFQRESRKQFVLATKAYGDEVNKNLTWIWNHSGRLADSHIELDEHATALLCEAHPPGYDTCNTAARWMAASGKPFSLVTPESVGTWGDWTLGKEWTVRAICSIALAQGGTVGINHVPIPCGEYGGRVAPPVYDLLANAMRWIKEREVHCLGKSSVPVMAILHSVANTRLGEAFTRLAQARPADTTGGAFIQDNPSLSPVPRSRALGAQNSFLASRLLRLLHVPTDFLYHEHALDNLDEYQAVFLPNVGYVDDALAERLRSYVAAGGNLLATYTTSFVDCHGEDLGRFVLADVFGADVESFSDCSIAYVDRIDKRIGQDLPSMPLLIKDAGYQEISPHRPIYCRLRPGAEVLACFTEPVMESDWKAGRHLYHDHAPPGRRTEWPAVVLNRYKKGKCVFLPFPLLQAWGKPDGNVWLRELAGNILAFLGVYALIKVAAGPAIEVVLRQDREGWILHVLHVQKENDSNQIDAFAHSGKIKCSIAPPWTVGAIEYAIGGKKIRSMVKGGRVTFTIRDVDIHEIIRIRKAK